jgi:Rieske Fe-S protein
VPDRRQKAKSPYTLDRNIPGGYEGETVTRRRFMVGGALAAGGIASAAFGLPALGFALGPVFERQEFRWQDIGALADFNDTNYTPKVIQIVAGIGEAGKSTAYVRKRNPQFDKDKPDEFNQIIAISTRCMHLGCPVRYIEASQRFICPCHGGVYDFTGARSGGPPVRPLDRFYTRIREGRVQLGPRYSVNSELQRYDPRDPGEPLDGIGPYAYPPRFSTPSPPKGSGQKGF